MDSDAMHKAILDCMKEPVYVRDLDMNLLYMNPAAKLLSGLSVEASQGKKYYEQGIDLVLFRSGASRGTTMNSK